MGRVTMKIRLEPGKCAGHAQCHAAAPGLFGIDDDGYSVVTTLEVPAGDEALAQDGVAACPELALVIEEDGAHG
jgi:ferredoxin